jgi:2-keto-4-pentenoate hydratase/2-oxohepta-3-ene-1,7-dioic acid hydratase in catechol pathway
LKLTTFLYDQHVATGAILDDVHVMSFVAAGEHFLSAHFTPGFNTATRNMVSFLAAGASVLQTARDLLSTVRTEWLRHTERRERLMSEGVVLEKSKVRVLAPVLRPSKIVAVGLNYMDHCREQNVPPPERPILFTKFPSSVIGPEDVITWDQALTSQVDYEAELAVVMGRRARAVKAEQANEYIAGYTALNDVSARDLQFSDGQWVRGKSLDTFCPMGPVLVTRDEIESPGNLKIQCRVNDALLQDSSTSEMIVKVPELIEFITHGITLEPGDVIATGTPHGVGVFRRPPVFLQPGDTVTVSIEGIGDLRNVTGAAAEEE